MTKTVEQNGFPKGKLQFWRPKKAGPTTIRFLPPVDVDGQVVPWWPQQYFKRGTGYGRVCPIGRRLYVPGVCPFCDLELEPLYLLEMQEAFLAV